MKLTSRQRRLNEARHNFCDDCKEEHEQTMADWRSIEKSSKAMAVARAVVEARKSLSDIEEIELYLNRPNPNVGGALRRVREIKERLESLDYKNFLERR